MATSDRDLAQQWLAERMVEIHESAWGVLPDQAGRNYLAGVARMLLDTPGVEVEEQARISYPVDQNARRTGPNEQERRLVILLPIDGKEERDAQR